MNHKHLNIRSRLRKIIVGEFPRIKDEHAVSRLERFNTFTVCGFVFLLPYLIFRDLPSGDPVLLARELASLTSFLVLIIWSRHTRHYRLVFHIAIAALVYTMISGYFAATAAANTYWIGVVPILSYLLLGVQGGTFWSMVFVGASYVVYYLSNYNLITLHYIDSKTVLNATLGVVGLSGLLFVYETINVTNEKRIADRDKSLEEANTKLNQELLANKEMATELTGSLEVTQKNNKQLQDTKLAMLNLLEDAKELEEQLKQEKQSIAQKVDERTQELHEEQARLKASINSLDSGFLMTDQNGTVISFNPALVRLFSLVPEDQHIPEELTIEQLQSKAGEGYDLRQSIKKCIKDAKPFISGEIAIEDKILTVFGSPVLAAGKFDAIGVVILVNDVTEIKILERTKDEFVSIASHELRTPLTAIRGNSAMLIEMYAASLPDDTAKQMLGDIKDASVRLISVVNQFLAMSRLEQGRTEFEVEPQDLPEIATRVVTNLRPLAEEKHLDLILNLPDKLPEVLADNARLEEVCTNLVGNAIKYTDKGSVTLTAKVEKDKLHVQVIDTGQGIDKESQDRLFQKFQQAASNLLTRDNSSSTGLGLYITKLLVEQMGGEIGIEKSELGKGSTFGFTLPIASDYNRRKPIADHSSEAKDKEQS